MVIFIYIFLSGSVSGEKRLWDGRGVAMAVSNKSTLLMLRCLWLYFGTHILDTSAVYMCVVSPTCMSSGCDLVYTA